MVLKHYRLPSLHALAAFEVSARYLSLTRAAKELNVTPGAISRQVRSLEDQLGSPLFLRKHRAVELTREGEMMAASLVEGFERISATVKQIQSLHSEGSVTIGTTMAMAQLWLMPRMGSFWNQNPEIVIDHVISDHRHGLDRPDIDVRIRYGDGSWPEERSAKLYDDRIFPVTSPAFAKAYSVDTIPKLAQQQLLSVEEVDLSWTTWDEFLAAIGHQSRRVTIRRFNSYVIALQAARSGQGVALGWESLVAPLIEAGHLVRVTDIEIAAPQSYYVTWSARRPLKPKALLLRDWLLSLGSLTSAQAGRLPIPIETAVAKRSSKAKGASP